MVVDEAVRRRRRRRRLGFLNATARWNEKEQMTDGGKDGFQVDETRFKGDAQPKRRWWDAQQQPKKLGRN